jgi:hypothetical protein
MTKARTVWKYSRKITKGQVFTKDLWPVIPMIRENIRNTPIAQYVAAGDNIILMNPHLRFFFHIIRSRAAQIISRRRFKGNFSSATGNVMTVTA